MIITYLSYMLTVSLGCIFELFILNKFLGYELRVKKVPLIITSVALAALMFLLVWKNLIDIANISMALFYMITPYMALDLKKKKLFILFGFVLDCFFDVLTHPLFGRTNGISESFTPKVNLQSSITPPFLHIELNANHALKSFRFCPLGISWYAEEFVLS